MLSEGLRVVWVDDHFNGGGLGRYRDVPANTKVDVLANLATTDFLQIIPGRAMSVLERMASTAHPLHMKHDPAVIGWTGLDVCHDFYTELSSAFSEDDNCTVLRGRVSSITAERPSGTGGWTARLHGAAAFHIEAPSVVIATGALPVPTPPEMLPSAWACEPADHPRVLPVESALQLDQLRKLVQPHERIGVIGGGHTGMVVTMHLTERVGAHCTQLFIRRPIRLASWDSTQQSYVSWAFRGLKGKAARFALDHGLAELEPPNGAVGDGSLGLELHHSSQLHSCKATASGLDAVVYCLGFGAPPMPTVRSGNSTVSISGHQVPGGALLDARRRPVPGLFGCGLGFSDSEYTSGAAYGVAGFMPFAMRAREIARQVATS